MPASLQRVDRMCDELKEFLDLQQLGSHFFDLSLILREALINAVVHGCHLDGNQRIRVNIQCEPQGIIMVVEDPGPGFDWQRHQGSEADIWQDHGRGMTIFRCYATDVTYNKKGNRITLRKSF